MDKEQRIQYVEAVSGTIPPRKASDMASYLYSMVNSLDTIIDMLRSDSPYQWKIAREKLVSFQTTLLVNAKYYEGLPLQLNLF